MIKLKPQWCLRQQADGRWTLSSEDAHLVDITPEQASILQKAQAGIPPEAFVDDITDEEFTHLETFINRGFISQAPVNHEHASYWELAGANFHSVQEQMKHLAINWMDLTHNNISKEVVDLLLQSGLSTTGRQTLTLVFVDSLSDLPKDIPGVVMPIVCNRIRVTVGPVLFPWSYKEQKGIDPNGSYVTEVKYGLPATAHAMQVAWMASCVLQYVCVNRLRYLNHFSEYNLAKMEAAIWPA